jgi:hypothetical protein
MSTGLDAARPARAATRMDLVYMMMLLMVVVVVVVRVL